MISFSSIPSNISIYSSPLSPVFTFVAFTVSSDGLYA